MAGEKVEEDPSWRHEKKGHGTTNKVQQGNSDHMEGKFARDWSDSETGCPEAFGDTHSWSEKGPDLPCLRS